MFLSLIKMLVYIIYLQKKEKNTIFTMQNENIQFNFIKIISSNY